MFNKKPNQYGATMVEYSLLVALIGVVCMSSINFMGREVACTFHKVREEGFEFKTPDIRAALPREMETDTTKCEKQRARR